MSSQVIEIARQEGIEFRSVRLTLEDDGAIKMDAQDMGPTVTKIWGDSDYEFWVHIAPAALPPSASCCDRVVAKLTPYVRAARPPPRTGNH
jgi:hypothetical protein